MPITYLDFCENSRGLTETHLSQHLTTVIGLSYSQYIKEWAKLKIWYCYLYPHLKRIRTNRDWLSEIGLIDNIFEFSFYPHSAAIFTERIMWRLSASAVRQHDFECSFIFIEVRFRAKASFFRATELLIQPRYFLNQAHCT